MKSIRPPSAAIFLSSAMKLWQGNIFTGVCHSVNRRVSTSVHGGIHTPWQVPPRAGTPPAVTPLGRYTPWEAHPEEAHPPRNTPSPTCRRSLQWTVGILLECFLVYDLFLKARGAGGNSPLPPGSATE